MLQDTTAGVTATAEILRSNSLSTRLQTRTAARPGATCLLHSRVRRVGADTPDRLDGSDKRSPRPALGRSRPTVLGRRPHPCQTHGPRGTPSATRPVLLRPRGTVVGSGSGVPEGRALDRHVATSECIRRAGGGCRGENRVGTQRVAEPLAKRFSMSTARGNSMSSSMCTCCCSSPAKSASSA